MPTPREREKAILQAIWRKAHTTGNPITIQCKNPNDAIRLRFQLQHVAAQVRRQGVAGELDLLDAVEYCICRVKESVVTVSMRDIDRLEAFADAVGLTEEEKEPESEKAARESLARLMGEE